MRLNLKGDYIKNTIILISGTGLAQAIPLIFSPLLTRIFSPADFGRLAFFMAMCSILSIVSTGSYELSVMLPQKDVTAFNIMILVVILAFASSLIILNAIILFGTFFTSVIGSPVKVEYLFLIPFGVFFTGAFQGLTYWLNRKKQYKIINTCKISQSAITVLGSIVLGYFGFKSYGLIIGFILGTLFPVIPLIYVLIKRHSLISRKQLLNISKTYINYPRLIMPSTLMNTAASQAPIFFITKFYSSVIVGSYSFATRILTAPIAIISTSIGQVYFQKISQIVNTGCRKIFPVFLKSAKTLSLVSLFLFLPFFLWGEAIFKLVFGANWAVAGRYVEIIAVAVFVKFVVSPLSTVFIATNKIVKVATWQATYFCTTIALFIIFKNYNFYVLLWIYVAHEIVLYTAYLLLMVRISKKYDKELSKLTTSHY